MKLYVYIIALVLAAVPARAQDAPPRFYDVARALYEKAGRPNTDEAIRAVNFQLAEQLAFDFPGDGWGMKKSGDANPPSKGCTARVAESRENRIVRGVCYDWITGNATILQPAILNDIAGQVFIPVMPRNHLGAAPPPFPPPFPPPPGSPVPPAPPELLTATAALQQQQLALLLQIIAKLETQLDQQRVQSAALEAAVRDLKAEIAKGIRVRF